MTPLTIARPRPGACLVAGPPPRSPELSSLLGSPVDRSSSALGRYLPTGHAPAAHSSPPPPATAAACAAATAVCPCCGTGRGGKAPLAPAASPACACPLRARLCCRCRAFRPLVASKPRYCRPAYPLSPAPPTLQLLCRALPTCFSRPGRPPAGSTALRPPRCSRPPVPHSRRAAPPRAPTSLPLCPRRRAGRSCRWPTLSC